MNTNPFRGDASRRMMPLGLPPGAGGFAGRTVPLSDPNRVVGSLGMNMETNPTEIRDDTGAVVDYPKHDGLFRPPDFVVVQSWRRNRTDFPNPSSFRLGFQTPKRHVLAIEVLETNFPNVNSTAPNHREFLIVNGLLAENGSLEPQTNIPYHAMETMRARPQTGATLANTFQWDDYALWRGNYDATKGHQYWKREGWHRKTWFPEPIERLDYLDLSVVDSLGTAYDFATNAEWSATLQIFCKQ